MIIKILDIGISNIQSVINAFTKIEKKVAICKNSHDFSNADAYVLPGVGSFDVAMNNILSTQQFSIFPKPQYKYKITSCP